MTLGEGQDDYPVRDDIGGMVRMTVGGILPLCHAELDSASVVCLWGVCVQILKQVIRYAHRNSLLILFIAVWSG